MNDSTEIRVSNLLQQGLVSYGTGQIARAFLIWNQVLELDPANAEALEYIRDADRREKPRAGAYALDLAILIDEARRLVRSENTEAALDRLTHAGVQGEFECEAMVDLLRAKLFEGYRAELGNPSKLPRLAKGALDDLRSRELAPSAGFLLSMIDGQRSLDELVSSSGMDRFDALRSLHGMFEAGILEWVR